MQKAMVMTSAELQLCESTGMQGILHITIEADGIGRKWLVFKETDFLPKVKFLIIVED